MALPPPRWFALAVLFAASATSLSMRAPCAEVPATLREAPRLGLVIKPAAARAKADELAASLADVGVRVEIVPLDSLPSKSAKTAPPRFVLVIDEAKAAPTSAVTHEYGSKSGGQTWRIRWRGAAADVHAVLHVFAPAPDKLGEFDERVDRSEAPDTYKFGDDESKKEIVVDPQATLVEAIENVVRRALACSAGIDLWRHRAELAGYDEALNGHSRAAFWSRAAWAAGDPEPALAIVPWRSLESAALETWRRAAKDAASSTHASQACVWCGKPLSDEKAVCACPDSVALAAALRVMKRAAERYDYPDDREKAGKIEVAWDKLRPSRPQESSAALETIARRLDAEHEADLGHLRRMLALDEVMKPRALRDWYLVLALRDPLDWKPSDPDLVRHAARVIQAFGYRTGLAGASFDVESDSPAIGLVRRRTGWEYTAVEKREFANTKVELLESMLERALWANARGVPKAP